MLAICVGACGEGEATGVPPSGSAAPSESVAPSASPSPTIARPLPVTLQLPWARGAQFAGFYAAVEQGYYDAVGLDVTIIDGGPEVEVDVLGSAADGPEFTVSWLPRILAARDRGASDLVAIAQLFQRSGTLSLSWRGADITGPEDFLGKRVEIRAFGDGAEVLAAARTVGLDPETDFRTVAAGADMVPLLSRQVDVAQAMLYDGYATILETTDPRTGAHYRLDDLNVINYRDEGTAMLQDGVYARAAWLDIEGNEAIATRFLEASFEGWIHCRDRPAECVEALVVAGATAGPGHLAWGVNEVNTLIWPSPNGIGALDPAMWQATVDVAREAGIISVAPPDTAYRTDLAATAAERVADLDARGLSFVHASVEITPGGE